MRRWVLLFILLLPVSALAQIGVWSEPVVNQGGQAIVNASVYLCNALPTFVVPCGGTTIATMYSNFSGTPITPPIFTDSNGQAPIYASSGNYYVQVSGPGLITRAIPITIGVSATGSNILPLNNLFTGNNSFTGANNFSGSSTFVNISNVLHVAGTTGVSLATALGLCSSGVQGCRVVVDGPLTFTSPIIAGSLGFPIEIDCLAPSGVNGNPAGTLITYSPTTTGTTALTFTSLSRVIINNCDFTQGNSQASTNGIVFAGTQGGYLNFGQITGFTGTGWTISDSVTSSGEYNGCQSEHINNNGIGLLMSNTNNNKSLNQNHFANCTFVLNTTVNIKFVSTAAGGSISENKWAPVDITGNSSPLVDLTGVGTSSCRDNAFEQATLESPAPPSNQVGIANGPCQITQIITEGGLTGAGTPVTVTTTTGTYDLKQGASAGPGGIKWEAKYPAFQIDKDGNCAFGANVNVITGTPPSCNFLTGEAFAISGATIATMNINGFVPVGLGPSLNNAKYVDGTSPHALTTQNVADNCENYPTNNGLRTCVINSPPELITINPSPPNFAIEWKIMPGSVHSTTCNSSNINCVVLATPVILGNNASVVGTAGPVGSGGDFSGGSAIIASDTFPAALGVPTGGATITCNGSGSVTAPFIAVRMVNNLETHPGKSPAAGFGAYIKKTGCTGVASIDITAPTGSNAGALAPVDFEVGVGPTLNGLYYLQIPGSGMTCSVAGTVDANEACKLTGGAHITAAQSQTCSSSCTTPFEMDAENGTPVDLSNPLIVMGTPRAGGGWSTQSFNTQLRDVTIACQPTGHGTTQPNVMIWDVSAEESSGTPASEMQFYGDCGGYTGTSGAFVYNGPWAPNSNWSHIQVSGGPTATANPFWAVIIDGHPTTPPVGGASGGARQMTDNTLNLRGGATANGAILIQGNRANVGVSDSHAEILNGNDAYFVTDGARAQFSHVEAFTSGNALHISSTAGMVKASVFCNQGTNSSNQDRCTPGATSIQDDTVGGGTVPGPVPDYTSGTLWAKNIKFPPLTFTQITAFVTCAAGTEGYEFEISDSTTAVFNANITVGGGTNHVLALCNGTNWTVH